MSIFSIFYIDLAFFGYAEYSLFAFLFRVPLDNCTRYTSCGRNNNPSAFHFIVAVRTYQPNHLSNH